jgi:hypothetical protein
MFPLHLDPAELAYLVRSATSGPVFGCRPEDLPAMDDPQLSLILEEGSRRLEERGLLQRDDTGRFRLPPDLSTLAQRIARPGVGVLLVRRGSDKSERFLYQVDAAGFSRAHRLSAGGWEVERPLRQKDFLAAILADVGELSLEPPPAKKALTFSLAPEALSEVGQMVTQGQRSEALGILAQLGVGREASTRWLHATQSCASISSLVLARCLDNMIDDVYSLTVVQSPAETWLIQVPSPDDPSLLVAPASKGEVVQLIERYYYELVFAELHAATPPDGRG